MILKKKIANALNPNKNVQRVFTPAQDDEIRAKIKDESQVQVYETRRGSLRKAPAVTPAILSVVTCPSSSKNIMKNYCRALTNFATSDLALSYLPRILEKNNIELENFREFIRDRKDKVNCIKKLRGLLLIEEMDSSETAGAKTVFKEISIIFLKFFSVNWIYNSKVSDKLTHLKYRFKILRRVKNPAAFTYLEDFVK